MKLKLLVSLLLIPLFAKAENGKSAIHSFGSIIFSSSEADCEPKQYSVAINCTFNAKLLSITTTKFGLTPKEGPDSSVWVSTNHDMKTLSEYLALGIYPRQHTLLLAGQRTNIPFSTKFFNNLQEVGYGEATWKPGGQSIWIPAQRKSYGSLVNFDRMLTEEEMPKVIEHLNNCMTKYHDSLSEKNIPEDKEDSEEYNRLTDCSHQIFKTIFKFHKSAYTDENIARNTSVRVENEREIYGQVVGQIIKGLQERRRLQYQYEELQSEKRDRMHDPFEKVTDAILNKVEQYQNALKNCDQQTDVEQQIECFNEFKKSLQRSEI